jgi:hypothetical protein
MLLAAVGAYAALAGDRVIALVAGLGVAGCVVVAAGIVFRVAVAIPWGVALVGASYAVYLRLRGGDVDTRAIYVAAALIVACELAFRSLRPGTGTPNGLLRLESAATLVAVALATMVLGDVVLVASGSARSTLFVEAIGAACAVAAVAFAVRTAARSRD